MLARQSGELIHGQRIAKGMSQAALARDARVSRTILSRLECGRATAVQTDVLDRLFEALDCNPRLGSGDVDVRKLARLELQSRIEQSRSRHMRLAIALADDPRAARPLIARAREQVELWRRKQTCSPLYIERWSEVLRMPPRRMAGAMASFGEWEDAMYQNSPWSWAWN